MSKTYEGIAIVGIGAIMPGALNKESFWDNIIGRKSSIIEVPKTHWDWKLYYDPDHKAPDKTYTKIGGFIQNFVFDPIKYRIPPQISQQMDSTQKLAIETASMAMADAGYDKKPFNRERTAVIIGNSMGGMQKEETDLRVYKAAFNDALKKTKTYASLGQAGGKALLAEAEHAFTSGMKEISEDTMPGELANVIAGRVANVLNVNGTNFAVDAACATSLAALYQAVNGLYLGKFDMAVCGGVDQMMSAAAYVKFCKIGALSAEGSFVFDKRADGFVMAEGAGALILKRVSDDVRDGDKIYAVIRAVGGSSDGKGKGITAPNPKGQTLAVNNTFEQLDYTPGDVGLLEAHGTATRVGDITEVNTMSELFGKYAPHASIGLGSVKSQIGHAKAAAGMASMVKIAMALDKKVLPPSINFETPNPEINWKDSPFRVLTQAEDWKGGKIRRAHCSAFGFGGTNFHVAVEEFDPKVTRLPDTRYFAKEAAPQAAPSAPVQAAPAIARAAAPALHVPAEKICGEAFVFSAGTKNELFAQMRAFGHKLKSEPSALAPEAAARNTAAHKRMAVAIACESADKLKEKIEFFIKAAQGEDPWLQPSMHLKMKGIYPFHPEGNRAKVGFMFPGQGSQYVDMMKDLASKYQVVQETFDEADRVLYGLINTTLTEVIWSKPGDNKESLARREEAIKQTQMTQPAVLTADIAMMRLLGTFGVKPDIVMGHSLGEYAAAVASGIFTFENGLRAVTNRAKEMSNIKVADQGKMASVAAPCEKVEPELRKIKGYVAAANKNCPIQTVIAGEKKAIDAAISMFNDMGIQAVEIPVSHAFHSEIIREAVEPYRRFLNTIPMGMPQIPLLSNVTADFFPTDEQGVRDLLVKQITSPVEWINQLKKMHESGVRLFIECGPKRVLSAFATSTMPKSKEMLVLSSNHPKRGGITEFNDLLANLMASGVPLNWSDKDPLRLPNSYSPAYTRWASEAAGQPVPAEIQQRFQAPAAAQAPQQPARERITISAQAEQPRQAAAPASVYERYGFNVNPIAISGIAAGTPGSWDKVFREGNIDEILRGQNMIESIPLDKQKAQLEKNVIQVIKSASGNHSVEKLESIEHAIKLAAKRGEFDLEKEFGLPQKWVSSMDITFKLSVAAGILALKDAGIPLVLNYKKTSTGGYLPEKWALPAQLADETGVIFTSAFSTLESIVSEVARCLTDKYSRRTASEIYSVYEEIISQMHDAESRRSLSEWFAKNFSRYHAQGKEGAYTFSQDFLLKVIPIGHSQFCQWIRARGPATHTSAACSSTTQAVAIGEDWIRTGRAKRVIIIGGDDITNDTTLEWILPGFISTGAATKVATVSEAALPFDKRRNGMIVGMGAVSLVLEDETEVRKRGMRPLARVLGTEFANSAFHPMRIDVNHVAEVMDKLVSKVERVHGIKRGDAAKKMIFMSHETYTPARGGSASAECNALKRTFGDDVKNIIVTNVKGFTGHTMGASLEDAVAVRALTTGIVPPIANYKEADPELEGINLSKGGEYDFQYAIRLGAGFGSQTALSFMERVLKKGEARVENQDLYTAWLAGMSGQAAPQLEVVKNTLRVKDAGIGPDGRPAVTMDAPQAYVDAAVKMAAAAPATVTHHHHAPAAQPAVAAPKPAPAPVHAPVAAAKTLDTAAVTEQILQMIVQKTGYPKDMLDQDLDMEADLGIDTVKQAELFAGIREHFNVPRKEGLKLKDYPTIRHCVQFVLDGTGGAASSAPAASAPVAVATPVAAHAPVEAPKPAPAAVAAPVSGGLDENKVRETILDMIVQKTGYPKDMLDQDLDMEADLGIDTVKQAELFAGIREHFNVPRKEGLKLKDYPTIRHCVQFVLDGTGGAAASEAPVQEQEESAPAPAAQEQPKTEEKNIRLEPTIVDMPLASEANRKLSMKRPVLIFSDNSAITRSFQAELTQLKVPSHVFTSVKTRSKNTTVVDWNDAEAVEKALRAYAETKPNIQGVLYMLGCGHKKFSKTANPHNDLQHYVMPLFMACKVFEQDFANRAEGHTFLAAATQLDGGFGYKTKGEFDPIYGAIHGTMQCLRKDLKELTGASSKLFDFRPEDSLETLAGKVMHEVLRGDERLVVCYEGETRQTYLALARSVDKKKETFHLKGKRFVVTGGGRGLGALFCKMAAEQYKPHIIALDIIDLHKDAAKWAAMSEQELSSLKNSIWQRLKADATVKATPVMLEREFTRMMDAAKLHKTLEELRALGADVDYHYCDVTDEKGVAALLGELNGRYGKLDGLVHFAGLERSKLFNEKTVEEFFRIYDVKATSAMRFVTSGAFKEDGFFVFASSIAGKFGNVGQSDYAAASDYSSKLAINLFNRGARAFGVDMSGYADIGMAVRPGVQAFLSSQGMDFLKPRQGMQAILDEIVYGKVPEIVLSRTLGKLDWDRQVHPDPENQPPQGGGDAEPSAGSQPQSPVPSAPAGDNPMLDSISELKEGKSLRAEKEFAVDRDNYLPDHAINGTPYVPGVMGIETFMEAAALFLGQTPGGLQEVRFALPIKLLRSRPQKVRVTAADADGDAFMRIESDFVNPKGVKLGDPRLHFAARSMPAGGKLKWETMNRPVVPVSFTPAVDKETIYKTFFHGPSFQVLDAIVSIDEKTVMAVYRRPSKPLWETGDRYLLACPLLIEAAFQACGYRDLHIAKKMTLPDAIGKVHIFNRGDQPDTLGIWSVFKGKDDNGYSIYDAFVFDQRGRLWVELEDYKMVPQE
ncbi:MAG: SDR family NAD(P)-dependent oxidoreductase [Elusimicrobia bacterium]|nr:SDR family NAD(P)-dependent oxidoreductase [Elusimicrobiota bacterium]